MAATSTNKQPLLIDHVLHYVVNLDSATNNSIDIVGTNTASIIVNAINTDGAIIEDIYSISRGTSPYKINLYLSSASDYLRPNESIFIGQLTSGTTVADVTHWDNMPYSLAPVPQVGDEARNRALYIPKGRALWAARESDVLVTDGPLLGCQGGWY